ncbi:MAG: hypothetical protein KJ625_08025, partial [Actinobacteria bacterium]|nr:hypothetical protein [Actinomycetota bacterium]
GLAAYVSLSDQLVTRVIECKSGNIRIMNDLFKLKGIMVHLNIQQGIYISKEPHEHADLARQEFTGDASYPIKIFNEHDTLIDDLIAEGEISERPEDSIVELWVDSYTIEDILIQNLLATDFVDVCRTTSNAKVFYQELYFQIWLVADPVERSQTIFEAYDRNSIRIFSYCDELGIPRDTILSYLTTANLDPDTLWYLELKGRLFNIQSFCEAVSRGITSIPTCSRFGLAADYVNEHDIEIEDLIGMINFFQVWVFGWGAFLLKNNEAEEKQIIAQQSHTSVEMINTYLNIYDALFPIVETTGDSTSHIGSIGYTGEWKILKWVPACIQGMGMKMRRCVFGEGYVASHCTDVYSMLSGFEQATDYYLDD